MCEIKELEMSITQAIASIKDGKSTPKKSGMGRMFTKIQVACPETYSRLLEEYRPVSAEFFAKKPPKKKYESRTEHELIAIEHNLSFEDADFDESGVLLPDIMNKILNDASSRIEGRRKKKPKIVPDPTKPRMRDRSGYNFNGSTYGKGPLVLAVVRFYVDENPGVDYSTLKNAFPDELLKSYGIFKKLEAAQTVSRKRKRYFLKDAQLIDVVDCQVAVCNQFTSGNISAFLNKAREIGYDIKENVQ